MTTLLRPWNDDAFWGCGLAANQHQQCTSDSNDFRWTRHTQLVGSIDQHFNKPLSRMAGYGVYQIPENECVRTVGRRLFTDGGERGVFVDDRGQ